MCLCLILDLLLLWLWFLKSLPTIAAATAAAATAENAELCLSARGLLNITIDIMPVRVHNARQPQLAHVCSVP